MQIANSAGGIIGYGATCGCHVDRGHCDMQKTMTRGNSGLRARDLILRLKRWLIAGIEDSDWDEEGRRSMHVSLGGRFLHEFAEGLSEEDCDRIANCEAPRAP